MLSTGVLRTAVVFAFASLMSLSACKAKKKAVEQEIAKELESVGVVRVECPALKKGKAVKCKAHTKDARTYDLDVSSTTGGAEWKSSQLRDGKLVSADIIKQFGKSGVEMRDMVCPDYVDPKLATKCAGTTAEGTRIEVRVELTREIAYNVDDGLLDLRKVEVVVREHFATRKLPIQVNCHGKILVTKAGNKATCEAIGGGQRLSVLIELKDDKGKFVWKTVALPKLEAAKPAAK